MTVTIDSAGRLVIPKAIRELAGLTPGVPLEISVRDGRIEIDIVAAPVTIEMEDGLQVARTRRLGAELTAEAVEEVRETLRQERSSRAL